MSKTAEVIHVPTAHTADERAGYRMSTQEIHDGWVVEPVSATSASEISAPVSGRALRPGSAPGTAGSRRWLDGAVTRLLRLRLRENSICSSRQVAMTSWCRTPS